MCRALTAEARERIKRAVMVASQAQKGAVRRSGEPFVCHPLAVALIVAQRGLDAEVIIAAVLHDTVEDTGYPLSEWCTQFGAAVAVWLMAFPCQRQMRCRAICCTRLPPTSF
jgi:GTP diphosphokinase / guanosine-3',5'-bis(diphosphate) 3'-diphosphatase